MHQAATQQRTCAAAPCKTCPYRKDVPSGIWHADEYAKLPTYDGDIAEQAMAGATARFDCHQQDGRICAGWVGTHGADNLLALRLQAKHIHPDVWAFASPVPLFASGAEAAAHGLRDIDQPGQPARRAINRLIGQGARK